MSAGGQPQAGPSDPRPPRVAAVLLAAGQSRRLAGIDKRTLTLDGVALVRRWQAVFADAGIDDVVIVTGHAQERLAPWLEGFDALRVHNPDPERGQQSSVVAGLAAVPAGIDAVIVVLVDLVLVDADDLRALVSAFRQRPAGRCAVIPFRNGQRGNPVLVSAEVAREVAVEAAPDGLRGYLQRHPEQVHRFQVETDHYFVDLDTVDDLDALEARLGRRFGNRGPSGGRG